MLNVNACGTWQSLNLLEFLFLLLVHPLLSLLYRSPAPKCQPPDSVQQKANLARIRDNQRRSRARKREYLQELEQRLRLCELQGIEASAEVQMAARRVAEENRQLRELLHKQGVSEEYIVHYLQASMIAPDLNPTLGTGIPPPSVQAMQQLLAPRRPNPVDPGQFPMTGQTSREASITSASTSASSLWEAGPGQGGGQGAGGGGGGGAGGAAGQGQGLYSGDATPRMDAFTGQQRQASVASGMMDAHHHGGGGGGHALPQGQHQHQQQHQQQQQQQQHHQQQQFSPQQVQAAMHAGAMGYGNPNVGPYNPDIQNYGPGGGGYG